MAIGSGCCAATASRSSISSSCTCPTAPSTTAPTSTPTGLASGRSRRPGASASTDLRASLRLCDLWQKGGDMGLERNFNYGRGPRVDRRTFLRYSGCAAAVAGGSQLLPDLPGRASAAAPTAGSAAKSFRWEEATIAEMQAAMKSGEVTSVGLTQAYIA